MKKTNLKVFAIGFLWAGLAALSPVATIILDDLHRNEMTDWRKMGRLSAVNVALGVAAYWRKHKALLELPPDIAAVVCDPEAPPQK